jgi:hypothetical protein
MPCSGGLRIGRSRPGRRSSCAPTRPARRRQSAQLGPALRGEALELGKVRLLDRTRLRVVDPIGQPEHDRKFLPARRSRTVPATVIRNRDGRSFFAVPAGDLNAVEQYQLRLSAVTTARLYRTRPSSARVTTPAPSRPLSRQCSHRRSMTLGLRLTYDPEKVLAHAPR